MFWVLQLKKADLSLAPGNRYRPGAPVLLASLQTLGRRVRLSSVGPVWSVGQTLLCWALLAHWVRPLCGGSYSLLFCVIKCRKEPVAVFLNSSIFCKYCR